MKNNMKYTIIILAAAVVTIGAILTYVSTLQLSLQHETQNGATTSNPSTSQVLSQNQTLRKFNSTDQLKAFLLDSISQNIDQYGNPQGVYIKRLESLGMPSGAVSIPVPQSPNVGNIPTSTPDSNIPHSSTNVQVENVDEPDFVKNDGKYAYIVSQDKLTIIDAYPGQTAKIISKVGLDIKNQNIQSMFVNNDRLVIFYEDYVDHYYIPQYDYFPQTMSTPTTHAVIIDVSDRTNPVIVKNYEVTGNYYNARMIGDYVYLVSNSYADYYHLVPPVVRESSKAIMVPDIYYFPNPEPSQNFVTITSINIFSDQINSTTFLTDSTSALYVSNDAMYIAYQKSYYNYPYYGSETYAKDRFFKAVLPLLPQDIQSSILSIDSSNSDQPQKWAKISDLLQNFYNKMSDNDKSQLFDKIQKSLAQYDSKIQENMRKTIIAKFSILNGTVNFVAQGEVQGYPLNQYSMDQFGDRFRIATTSEYYNPINGTQLTNNVYVLDKSLNTVGSLEKFASDESIYAARFMGDKLYLVTFQRIDPFFVIDLSTDTPKILGALKIPGYSGYLHPYDQTHIIGIGKQTEQNQYGGISQTGVKVSLFDVSNVTNPITINSYVIGGQGTDSDVLQDPKALLFDKVKNVLVIPARQQNYYPLPMKETAQGTTGSSGGSTVSSGNATSGPAILPTPGMPMNMPPNFGNNNWSGFYVFGIDTTKGLFLKGTVVHYNGTNYQQYYYPQESRSFYIGDSLYTVSPGLMKINDLNNIANLINEIKLSDTGQLVKYLNQ